MTPGRVLGRLECFELNRTFAGSFGERLNLQTIETVLVAAMTFFFVPIQPTIE